MQTRTLRRSAMTLATAMIFAPTALLASGSAHAILPAPGPTPSPRPIPVPIPDPDSQYLLLELLDRVEALQDRLEPATVTLSSGVFSLPANARSVDWKLLNNDTTPQTVTVTVYKTLVGQVKTVVAPGPITVTLPPGRSTHNANSVPTVFQVGGSYEVVVSGGSPKVLPTVMVWSDLGNTVIPGTQIHAGEWARID